MMPMVGLTFPTLAELPHEMISFEPQEVDRAHR